MNFERLCDTAGLFLGGAYFITKGIDFGIKHVARESPITLLTTGALLIPLSILIGIATKKIFDDLGWQSSKARDLTIYIFTLVSSTTLSSAAAVGFGFTTSLSTGLTVSAIASQLFLGIFLVIQGIENSRLEPTGKRVS